LLHPDLRARPVRARPVRGTRDGMESRHDPSLEVLVLRGVDGYMAVVLMSGEWVGFYPAETRTAATAQAVLAVTEIQPT